MVPLRRLINIQNMFLNKRFYGEVTVQSHIYTRSIVIGYNYSRFAPFEEEEIERMGRCDSYPHVIFGL